MIEDAEREGLLQPYTGSRIFEGTVGSTGISIATIARARCVYSLPHLYFIPNGNGRGYDASEKFVSWAISTTLTVLFEAIIMPDDVALEKVKALEALGADVERVRPASIVDKKQASLPVDFSKYCRSRVLLFL